MPPELIARAGPGQARRGRRQPRARPARTKKADAIVAAADEVLAGSHRGEFPLAVWQTGSGTQSNMNVNEVLANRASELLGGERGEGRLVHPNDDVNLGQSSNDVFPTAMHVAAAQARRRRACCRRWRNCAPRWTTKARDFADIVKIGRTHLQDATPLTLGQEFSGYVAQLDHCAAAHPQRRLPGLLRAGRSAAPRSAPASTRIRSSPRRIAAELAARTGAGLRRPRRTSSPRWPATTRWCAAHGALKTLAAALMKIANDVRWLASGPRSRPRRDHAFPRTSRAARSCRARSIRRSARR